MGSGGGWPRQMTCLLHLPAVPHATARASLRGRRRRVRVEGVCVESVTLTHRMISGGSGLRHLCAEVGQAFPQGRAGGFHVLVVDDQRGNEPQDCGVGAVDQDAFALHRGDDRVARDR